MLPERNITESVAHESVSKRPDCIFKHIGKRLLSLKNEEEQILFCLNCLLCCKMKKKAQLMKIQVTFLAMMIIRGK